MLKNFFTTIIVYLLITQSNFALAIVSIDITRGNADPIPVALPDFSGVKRKDRSLGKKVTEVMTRDLERSGLFRSIDKRAFLQDINGSDTIPEFSSWRQINATALVTGSIDVTSRDEFNTEFRLWDVFAENQMAGKTYSTNLNNWRRISHLMADEIYSRITGEKGYFDSRVVYVAESGSHLKRVKRLAIMDQDGANHRYLTDGKNLVLTPRFSPTAHEVIYMSYGKGVPQVYILNVDSGKSTLVGSFSGMSFAPRYSIDGKSILMSVSLDGNSEIYKMNLKTKRKKRLTFNRAIDTSPSMSPNGKYITFNSDRGGSQQIYVMDSDGGNIKRISFGKGRYATPVWSPRGDLIAFTKMYKGRFYIGIMRTDGTGERLLTESFLDEGPTWAPNGRVIIFARQRPSYRGKPGKWSIHSVDLTGYNEIKLKTPKEASDPAWSSLL